MIQLSSNDYLGLNQHPKVIEAGQKALKKWGASSTGSRISNGGRAYHRRLEEKLADFLGTQDCHIHAAGYLSCMSSIQGLATRNDVVFADRNIHSSLWSGIGMSRARVEKFSHNDPSSLLRAVDMESPKKAKLLVFEGVYSMEGHIAPLPEFLEIARNHDLFTVMDDAHGVGVIGETGRGTAEHFDCSGKVDLICGSLSKALATTGGYVAGDKELLEYMRTHSKQTIFSAAISPAQAACAEAALELIATEPEHLIRLINNTKHYKSGLEKLGIDTWGSQTAAVPLIIGDRLKAYKIWKELIAQGVFTTISLPPSVPPNKELLRTAISSAHTIEDIDQGLDRLATAFNKFR
jgi:8-amino-7-oxononanoate synthase